MLYENFMAGYVVQILYTSGSRLDHSPVGVKLYLWMHWNKPRVKVFLQSFKGK